jgi:threonine dehydratase
MHTSNGVAVGALIENIINLHELRIGIIISSGNVDLDRLTWQNEKDFKLSTDIKDVKTKNT